MKRIISVILCIALFATFMPIAFAEEDTNYEFIITTQPEDIILSNKYSEVFSSFWVEDTCGLGDHYKFALVSVIHSYIQGGQVRPKIPSNTPEGEYYFVAYCPNQGTEIKSNHFNVYHSSWLKFQNGIISTIMFIPSITAGNFVVGLNFLFIVLIDLFEIYDKIKNGIKSKSFLPL